MSPKMDRVIELIEKQMVLTLMKNQHSTDMDQIYNNSINAAKACQQIRRIFRGDDMNTFDPTRPQQPPQQQEQPRQEQPRQEQPRQEQPRQEQPPRREPMVPSFLPDYPDSRIAYDPSTRVGNVYDKPYQQSEWGSDLIREYPAPSPQVKEPSRQWEERPSEPQKPDNQIFKKPTQECPDKRDVIAVLTELNAMSQHISNLQRVIGNEVNNLQDKVNGLSTKVYKLLGE